MAKKRRKRLAKGGYQMGAGFQDDNLDYGDATPDDANIPTDYGDATPGEADNAMDDGVDYTDPSPQDMLDQGGGQADDYQDSDLATNQSTLNAFTSVQSKQAAALKALQEAQTRAVAALQPQQDHSAMWLAAASGLLSPTRTGSFGESLGNAAGQAAPYEQHYADSDAAAKTSIGNLEYGTAAEQYKDAMKPPQIIDWYARTKAGQVGKQKALIVDGQPVPFGEILTAPGGGSFKDKLDLFNDPKYGPLMQKYMQMNHPPSQSVTNVTNSVPFESESQKKAADRLDDLFKQADTSRQLAVQLNAVAPYIEKTPNAYFGPGGSGLVTIGKGLKQIGFDVGDGLDTAGFVQSVMNHLGPAQRIVGSGSSSDRDVNLFMSSLPGLANTKEGNRMLVKYYNKLNDYNQKLVRVIRQYAKTHQDFYGIEDLPTEEIDKAGRVFSEADLQEMQKLSGNAPETTNNHGAPKSIKQTTNPDGTITLTPGQ